MTEQTLVERVLSAGLIGYSTAEIDYIGETLASVRPDFIAEWGTNVGESARIFFEAAKYHHLDCEIHSVETYDEIPILRPEDAGRKRGHFVLGLPVFLHVGEGTVVSIDLYRNSNRIRPLFFLDDSHLEDGVFDSLEKLGEITEATILVHDADLVSSGEPDRAIRRFLERGGWSASVGPCMVRLSHA